MYKTKKKKEVLEGKEYVKQDLTGFFVENKKKKIFLTILSVRVF